MSYHKGQQITCPHCGEETLVKVESVMDGWTKTGEYFACAICKEKLAELDEGKAKGPNKAEKRSKGADDLMDFLGTSKEEVGEVVDDDGSRAFCKDCSHLLEHPFKIYCLFHKKDVNPMDDCDSFERKKS